MLSIIIPVRNESENLKNIFEYFFNNIQKIDHYLEDNVIYFDQEKDTIAQNKAEYINAIHSLKDFNAEWTNELNKEETMVRFKKGNQIRTYKLKLKNGKIIQIEYLGFFRYDN